MDSVDEILMKIDMCNGCSEHGTLDYIMKIERYEGSRS